jgi:hypothetical protein
MEMENIPHRREWILHYPEGAHLLLFPSHCRRIDVNEAVAEILSHPTMAMILPAPAVTALAEEISTLIFLSIHNRLTTVTKRIDYILSIDPRTTIISDVGIIQEYIPEVDWKGYAIEEYTTSNDYAVVMEDATLDRILQASRDYRLDAEALELEVISQSYLGLDTNRSRSSSSILFPAIHVVTERGYRIDVISISLNPNFIHR